MILCETVLGCLKDEYLETQEIDYVDIEWHEAFKRIHQKISQNGRKIGIRLGTEILTKGLREGDILWQEGQKVLVVRIPPCEVIAITIDKHHPETAYKVCYEIGNKHAALIRGEEEIQFITPYNEPTLQLLQKLHGVHAEKRVMKLDFDKAISSTVSSHTH
mgnify:CR=1 FL=1